MCGTTKWYLTNMLQPNRIKCGGLSGVFKTCYYRTVLWGGSPDPPKGPGRLGSPDVARVQRLVVRWLLPRCQGPPRCARALGMWAPLAYPAPPTLKKAAKTIKNYGWYSGPCLGATVGQVWNSSVVFNKIPPNRFKCGGLGGVFKTCYYLTVLWG